MALVEISKCAMTDCKFNQGGECVTREIEVDDAQKCVTYKPKAQAAPPPPSPTPVEPAAPMSRPQPRPTPPAPQGANVDELMELIG